MTMFSSQWFGGSSSIEGSNTDNTRSSTDATTFTFSDQDIGGAATNRVIAVAVGMGANTALRDIDSVTVGGTNLSKQVGSEVINAGVENFRAEIWSAVIASGTEADIVVTLSGAVGSNRGVGISVHRLIGNVSATPDVTETASDDDGTTDPLTVSVNTEINGYVICCGVSFKTSPNTATWSGATEVTDAMTGNIAQTAANYSATSDETPRTITVTFTSGGSACAAASASWFPS